MLCACGRWEFRQISVATGTAAVERHCPRCDQDVLLCFRGPTPMVVVPLEGGRQTGRLEAALAAAGFDTAEVALLVTVARLMDAS